MNNKFRAGVKYAVQFLGWLFLLFLATEIFTRLVMVSAPTFESKINGGGVEIYGIEGYGVIYYLPNMEIATPYSGGENIVTLGDSYTQARHLFFWKNYSSVAEKELRSEGYAMDVRNFGYMGTAFPYYLGIGKSLIETYHPSLVAIQLSLEDFTGSKAFDKTAPFYFAVKSGDLVLKNRLAKDNRWIKSPSKIRDDIGFSFYSRLSIETLLYIRNGQDVVAPDEGAPLPSGTKGNKGESAVSNKPGDKVKMSSENIYAQSLSLLESIYGDTPIVFIIEPDFSKKNLSFYYKKKTQTLVSLIERRPFWSVIYLDEAFNRSFNSGISPIGFGNTDPFSGHWNNRGHEIVGKLLAERIAEILGK